MQSHCELIFGNMRHVIVKYSEVVLAARYFAKCIIQKYAQPVGNKTMICPEKFGYSYHQVTVDVKLASKICVKIVIWAQ